MSASVEKSHVVLAYDQAFWAPGYATARSVFLTAERPRDVVVHILHDGLRPDAMDLVKSLENEYGGTVAFYDVAERGRDFHLDGLLPKPAGRFSAIVYARLFMFDLLPADVSRAVYLDTDVFVRSPIEWLLAIDLEKSVIGAAAQPERIRQLGGRDLREKSLLKMGQPYFNSGVLLVDAERYRNVDIKARIRERVGEKDRHWIYYDQDVINLAFRGEIKLLDMRWNMQNPEPAHEALDPHILHYSGSVKPWRLRPKVAFAATYRHLMTNDVFYRYWLDRLVAKIGFRRQ